MISYSSATKQPATVAGGTAGVTNREQLIEVMGEAFSALPECSVATAMEQILTALEAAGVCLVPKEATEEMNNSARDWSKQKYGLGIGNDASVGCYTAMLSSSPYRP